ncbi:uncharacterized protein LOC115686953 isoform X2 [Syzygium oleosum]|uniref:uncharacterized protein LOC115686953 isoform X2 n=1 Tax=Syzygium oleosum TaxID=219896 RepID=UPI0024B95BD2|nr:uncharacterized protein LOC115686953 isoform X2 [Syzygium oleosum]
MRIRKNAKLSSLLGSLAAAAAASPPEAPLPSSHVCLLNQSPWDVLPFSSFPDALPPSGSSSPLPHQLDGGEDSFAANGSFGDSIGAVESVASMMAVDADEKTVIVNKLGGHAFYDINNEDRMHISGYEAHKGGDLNGDFNFKACCNKTDGKRWQCKNEAADGHYLCEHHLSQLKSYATAAADDDEEDNADDDSASRKLDKSSASTGRRGGRPRGAKKNSSSSSSSSAVAAAANSSQFYYYSGFGPSWGKRRSGRAGDQQPRRPEGRAARGGPRPAPQRIGGGRIDYVGYNMEDEDDDEEEEEEEEDEDMGKKRTRKPVKARSLKSLM